MYCVKCGNYISSDSKVCSYCGQPQGVQNFDQSPFGQPYADRPVYSSQSRITVPVVAAILIFIIAFSSIGMTWLTLEAKVYGQSSKQTLDFTEIMEKDEDFTGYSNKINSFSKGSSGGISESDYDAILNSYHTMKYAGLVGYILLGIAFITTFLNRKAMTVISLLAAAAFAVAMIGGIIYCSKTMEFMDDITKLLVGDTIPIKYNIHINIGIIAPLVSAIAVTAIGFFTEFRNKELYY